MMHDLPNEQALVAVAVCPNYDPHPNDTFLRWTIREGSPAKDHL
ncbi:MAG: hypothetical protein RLN89_07750 [Parvibaculum sp.]